MEQKYKGTYKREVKKKKSNYDWTALIYWIVSLLVSLIPMYIEFIKYLNANNKVDSKFWIDYYVNGDILWVFSTLLLFVLADSILKKRRHEKNWINNLFWIGIFVFLIVEVTWIVFHFLQISNENDWPLYLGGILTIATLVISTPLKIEFIKKED